MKTSNTAERLKQWLQDNNAKQVDILSRAQPYIQQYGIRLNKNDISQYISGKVEPGQKKLFILAKALNVSEAWLMGYDSSELDYAHTIESIAYRIVTLMKYRAISLSELSKLTGIDIEALHKYIYNTPDSEFDRSDIYLQKILRALGVNDTNAFFGFNTFSDDDTANYISFLFEKMNKGLSLTDRESSVVLGYLNGEYDDDFSAYSNIIPIPAVRRIPLLGDIACGDPILAIDNSDESVTVPETLHADFALRCKGDSMVNARILDGDIVYIQRQDDVDNGEIAAVIIDDEATLKRVYKDDRHEQLTLMPENPAYPPLVYRGEELNNIRIIGKVVGFFSSQIK